MRDTQGPWSSRLVAIRNEGGRQGERDSPILRASKLEGLGWEAGVSSHRGTQGAAGSWAPGFCFAGRERPELICPSHNTDTGKLFPLWRRQYKG